MAIQAIEINVAIVPTVMAIEADWNKRRRGKIDGVAIVPITMAVRAI